MSKFIPDGRYMLDDVEIKSDVKGLDTSQFEQYVRQKAIPNGFRCLRYLWALMLLPVVIRLNG